MTKTLLDEFAMAALTGLMTQMSAIPKDQRQAIVEELGAGCYAFADILLAEKQKRCQHDWPEANVTAPGMRYYKDVCIHCGAASDVIRHRPRNESDS